jgi:hypothetical protein
VQAVDSSLGKALSPLAHGLSVYAQTGGDVYVLLAVGRRQDDPAAQRQGLGALRAPGPELQRLPFLIIENDHCCMPCHERLQSSLTSTMDSPASPRLPSLALINAPHNDLAFRSRTGRAHPCPDRPERGIT